jgi:hypothetical protein
MSNISRVLYMVIISLAVYIIALGFGYVWARAMHYPFTQRQRLMWNYYVMWMTAIPVLGPLMVVMGRWLMPVKTSIVTTVILLLIWMVSVFYIVRRMSRPRGRLSRNGT